MMIGTKRLNGFKKEDYFFSCALLLGITLCLWRLPFGSGFSDEPFYISSPYRFIIGERPFVDEWHVAQISSLLLYPILKIYLWFTKGSTEEIILAFRYIYVFFQVIVCCTIYLKLRKKYLGASIGALLFLVFAPYDMMALSYNTMGSAFVILTAVFLCTAVKTRDFVIAGVFYGCAVLCCPYLIFGYGIVSIFIFAAGIKQYKKEMFIKWGYFTGGAFGVAVIAFTFILSRVTLGDILEQIPYIFMDEGHAPKQLWKLIILYFGWIFVNFIWFVPTQLVLLAGVVWNICKKKNYGRYLFGVSLIITLISLLTCVSDITTKYHNFLFPMTMTGLIAYILLRKKDHRLFFFGYLGGGFYSFCLNATSDNTYYAIFLALVLMNISSIIFCIQYVQELKNEYVNRENGVWKRGVMLLLSVTFVTLLGVEIYVKTTHLYWQPKLEGLDSEYTWGPLKGVRDKKAAVEKYDKWKSDMDWLKSRERDLTLIASMETWPQLYLQFPYSYSAWTGVVRESTAEMIRTFYEVHPDRIPVYVYIPYQSGWDLTRIEVQAAEWGYQLQSGEMGYILEKDRQ